MHPFNLDMNTTTHEKTDFGDLWYVNSTDGSFRFAIYRYDDDSDTVYLSNVFVREESRGKGYGNCILDTTNNMANEMSAKMIGLKVKKGSFAHQWYSRHGYSDLTDDEENSQFVWMTKSIE